jgi:hypothetical protein
LAFFAFVGTKPTNRESLRPADQAEVKNINKIENILQIGFAGRRPSKGLRRWKGKNKKSIKSG